MTSSNQRAARSVRAPLQRSPLLAIAFLSAFAGVAAGSASPNSGPAPVAVPKLALEPDPAARFRWEGPLGERVRRNTAEWLIPAPRSNPGMLEMFRVRDRQPVPQLVPWAGEFAGKYLISAVQALRQDDNPELRRTVRQVVTELEATQASDGYLGPFPRAERLRGHWDLWGHYHCMLGLMLWHAHTGDATALRTARRAADLICATYLDTGRRVIDAGSPEMNMAAIHGLALLYEKTGEPRYLRMAREIEKDWERAGDYLRTGLSGEEFFQTPSPRWESLHDLQGLVELYRITGDPRYRRAFEHHWRSILRWDRRNTGGFSSGEQATGDPYAETAIETCCTVAWMALTEDMLRLTGDPQAADELELSTYNAGAGAQHPSGRWWTYNTPMDGAREASAHTIVFQARAGTPELNCCSVNGPRVLGMLSEWTVMRDRNGLAVNAYGPGLYRGQLADRTPLTLRWETDYPRSGHVTLRVEAAHAARFPLRLRIPRWSTNTRVSVNGAAVRGETPGQYLRLDRRWTPGDRITLDFDMSLRYVPGAGDQLGKVSFYRGPVLLAYDQQDNAFDESALSAVDLRKTPGAAVRPAADAGNAWLRVDLPTTDGRTIRLRDFASAGSVGTHYRSWLPVSAPPAPPVVTRLPRDGEEIPAGKALFRWTGPAHPNVSIREYRLVVADNPELLRPVAELSGLATNWAVLDQPLRVLSPGKRYWWAVQSLNSHGATPITGPAAAFTVNPHLPPLTEAQLRPPVSGEVVLAADLAGNPDAKTGRLAAAEGVQSAAGPEGRIRGAVALSGERGKVTYRLGEFPEEDYTLAVRVRIERLPLGRLGQVFSAWCAPMDDPLRVCVEHGRLYARVEAGNGYGTEGFPVHAGQWYDVVAVKEGTRFTLYVDGAVAGRAMVPYAVHSRSLEVAIGGNPRFGGNESLPASFADLSLHARAFTAEEVRRFSASKSKP